MRLSAISTTGSTLIPGEGSAFIGLLPADTHEWAAMLDSSTSLASAQVLPDASDALLDRVAFADTYDEIKSELMAKVDAPLRSLESRLKDDLKSAFHSLDHECAFDAETRNCFIHAVVTLKPSMENEEFYSQYQRAIEHVVDARGEAGPDNLSVDIDFL